MSTPLTATYRIEQDITVENQLHKMRVYLGVVPSADTTGYDAVDRLGVGGLGLSQAVDALLTIAAPLYEAAHTAFGPTTLQNHAGIAWNPVAVYQSAVTPSGTAPFVPASQLTLSMRDTAFHKVRNLVIEAASTIPLKTNSPAGFGAPFTAWAQGWTQVQIFASHLPWLWARGRSNLYIGSFVSMVTDANDRVRRTRGIA